MNKKELRNIFDELIRTNDSGIRKRNVLIFIKESENYLNNLGTLKANHFQINMKTDFDKFLEHPDLFRKSIIPYRQLIEYLKI